MTEDVVDNNGGGGRGIPRPGLNSEKLCYTIPEAAKLLGLSRNFGYELARRGELPIVRFGKRMLVPKAALHEQLSKTKAEKGGVL